MSQPRGNDSRGWRTVRVEALIYAGVTLATAAVVVATLWNTYGSGRSAGTAGRGASATPGPGLALIATGTPAPAPILSVPLGGVTETEGPAVASTAALPRPLTPGVLSPVAPGVLSVGSGAASPAAGPSASAAPGAAPTPAQPQVTPPVFTVTQPPASVAYASPAPTAASLPAAPPTVGGQDRRAHLLQRMGEQEALLVSGRISAVMTLTGGANVSTADLAFDLGRGDDPPRLRLITIYSSGVASSRTELVMIGADSWQRRPDGSWVRAGQQESVWGQIQAYLPRAALISPNDLEPSDDQASLRWYDSAREVETTVEIDPATFIPRRLTRIDAAAGSKLTIDYAGWNVPVTINPPQ